LNVNLIMLHIHLLDNKNKKNKKKLRTNVKGLEGKSEYLVSKEISTFKQVPFLFYAFF
jgi:hypothetical protein